MEFAWADGILTAHVDDWWQWFFYPFHFGSWGVTLFFVISGFCIHWSYLQWRQQHSAKKFWPQYFVRRFFRIYPPYLASIIMILAVGILFERPRNLPAMRDLVLHLFMVHNFSQDSFFKLTGSFWSLAVEVQLYIVYPLFLMLTIRLGFRIFLTLCGMLGMLSAAWNYASGSALPFWISQLPFFYWFTWGLGALVAEQHFQGKNNALRLRSFGWPLFLLAVVAAHFRSTEWLSALAIASASAIWLTSSLQTVPNTTSIIWQIIRCVGVISYSMYLFHGPLLQHLTDLLKDHLFGNNLQALSTFGALICFAIIAAASYMVYRFIELPSQRFGKFLARRLEVDTRTTL